MSVYDSVKIMKCNKGFSLLDVCVFLIVLGFMLSGAVALYQSYLQQKSISQTDTALMNVTNAVNAFIATNGRYPRPASLIAVEGATDFGTEGPATPPDCDDTSWRTTTGMCLSPNGAVLVGGVPFQVLGINPDVALDFWNQRIVYAVTLSQTDDTTYVPDGGGAITTQAINRDPADPTTPFIETIMDVDTGVTEIDDMLLLSHGREGRGAYSRDGQLVQACDASLYEGVNCEYTHHFFRDVHPENRSWGSRSLAQNTDYYDDFTRVQLSIPVDNWRRSENPLSDNFLVTQVSRIGVGTQGEPFERVHIIGDLRATDEMRSNQLCRDGAVDCFTPAMIGGDLPQMDCRAVLPSGTPPVVRLGSGQVFCGVSVTGVTPTITGAAAMRLSVTGTPCGGTQYMTGINASGVPTCGP